MFHVFLQKGPLALDDQRGGHLHPSVPRVLGQSVRQDPVAGPGAAGRRKHGQDHLVTPSHRHQALIRASSQTGNGINEHDIWIKYTDQNQNSESLQSDVIVTSPV